MNAKADSRPNYPVTPDGRYFAVRGRLWRMSNPQLPQEVRSHWVHVLMQARRRMSGARLARDMDGLRRARMAVDEAKRALGERGPVWWIDGAPDYNRHLVKNTPYTAWFDGLPPS